MRARTWEGSLILAAVLLIVAAGLVLLAVSRWESGPFLLVLFLLIAALALIGAAVGILTNAVDQYVARHQIDRARVEAAQARSAPEVVKIEAYRDMVSRLESARPEVLQILMGDPLLAQVIAGNFGPVAGVSVKDGVIPYAFIDEWYAVNRDRDGLVPVNQWTTTGGKREYASWLERHLMDMRILTRWAGNRTASWVDEDAKREFLRHFYGDRIRHMARPVVRADDDGAEEPA